VEPSCQSRNWSKKGGFYAQPGNRTQDLIERTKGFRPLRYSGPLLFSLFFRFSQKLPSTSFSQNLVSKIFTTI
jgi:hypothetical protein